MPNVHKKTLRYVAVSLALLLLSGGFMVLLYRRVIEASAVVKNAEREIAVLEHKERGIDNNKNGLDELDVSIAVLEESFVSQQTFVQFVELIERLAQETNIVFRAQGASLPGNQNERASLRFEVEGSYAALTRFFILLDAVHYAGFVGDMRIVPIGEDAKTIRASVTFIIFNFLPAV